MTDVAAKKIRTRYVENWSQTRYRCNNTPGQFIRVHREVIHFVRFVMEKKTAVVQFYSGFQVYPNIHSRTFSSVHIYQMSSHIYLMPTQHKLTTNEPHSQHVTAELSATV
jgi:hypothetical protein